MALFVTLEQAKQRLRITTTDEDVDLQSMIDQAEAHIVNWCSVTAASRAIVATWTAVTVPPVVVVAILIQTGELDRFRGDDVNGPPRPDADGGPCVPVRELLRAYHDLAMA